MWVLSILPLFLGVSLAEPTGNHPEWDRWCGKVYQPQYPSFNPGGQLTEPPKLSDGPRLHLQVKPRYSLYLENEKQGEFLIAAEISEWFGQAWPSLDTPEQSPDISFTITTTADGVELASGNFSIDSKSASFDFDVSKLTPRFEAYLVTLTGKSNDVADILHAETELLVLPEKMGGSVTKLDNLNGGMLFRNSATDGKFVPLLPYGFYASCDGFLCNDDANNAIKKYWDLGLNGMIPLTPISSESKSKFDYFNELDLKFMYDLRGYYKNLTEVHNQVSDIKDFDALYAYWGSDEPDGHQDEFNLTILSRDVIRQIDPYHPVSVTLNCENYYFEEYTAGADFIMGDPYPIGINSTFSKWGTACNSTYGDCGCDNCEGSVYDVSARLDTYNQYEHWLGLWPKTKVHNPQSFNGEGYWARDPTVDEEIVMNALAFNHGAKSIISWVWPTSDELAQIHGKFASVVTKSPAVDFIVSEKVQSVDLTDRKGIDAAIWTSESGVLISVVNGGEATDKEVIIDLPDQVVINAKQQALWGQGTWTIDDGCIRLRNIGAMSTNMIMISGE